MSVSHSKPLQRAALCALAALTLLLGGCGGSEFSDLNQYVKEVKSRKGGKIEPLPEVAPYETFVYKSENLRNPFERPQREEVQRSADRSQELAPNLDRPKDVLEQFPLDALRMMGTLSKDQELWALIKASDGTLYRVKRGDYMGHDYGRVIRIAENQITLRETIADGLGGWTTRETTLETNNE